MAWIVGLATAEKIKEIKDAGYDVTENPETIEELVAKPVPNNPDKRVAIWVDCDIDDLLILGKES